MVFRTSQSHFQMFIKVSVVINAKVFNACLTFFFQKWWFLTVNEFPPTFEHCQTNKISKFTIIESFKSFQEESCCFFIYQMFSLAI